MSRKPPISSSKSTASGATASAHSRVKVAVRCRPAFQDEIEFANNEFFSIVEMKSDAVTHHAQSLGQLSLTTIAGKQRDFFFDHVFADDIMQDVVYDKLARPVVNEVLKGCNGTIFAYGQTGTGKTYTMGILEFVHDEHAGLIPRAIFQIFEHVHHAKKQQDDVISVSMSFLQLYRENIQDLLAPAAANGGTEENLAIREDPVRGFYVEGLQEFAVRNYREAEALINLGLENRAIAPTLMNSTSSRSHTVLTIHIEQRLSGNGNASYSKTLRSKLLMVDLAGSERVRRTVSKGTRLSEAKSINTSLSALGNVIAALAEQNVSHVPYRDSKLTRLLQDSLGGNAATALIATIGPAAVNYGETLSTLLFAQRCMAVKITPVPHEEIDYAEMCAKLQSQINAMEGKMSERLLEQQSGYEQTIERLSQELEAEREHSQQAQFLHAQSESADHTQSAAFQEELHVVLSELSRWRKDETALLEESWLRKPLGFSPSDKRPQSASGQLVSVLAYAFELVKFFAFELNALLLKNQAREEQEKEEFAELCQSEQETEEEREWERARMAQCDPRNEHQEKGKAAFGGHLAPLSKADALRRVEAMARSNNTPVGPLDRRAAQGDPALRVAEQWSVRDRERDRGTSREREREEYDDDVSTEDDQHTHRHRSRSRSRSQSRATTQRAHTTPAPQTARTPQGELPLLPSVQHYQSLEEVVAALHALHSHVSRGLAGTHALLARKDWHFAAAKRELAAQLVEKRRREEEVVNWSFILKHLLATSTKLRVQLQRARDGEREPVTTASGTAVEREKRSGRERERRQTAASVRMIERDESESEKERDENESVAPPPPPPLSHTQHTQPRTALERLFTGRESVRASSLSPGAASVATTAQRERERDSEKERGRAREIHTHSERESERRGRDRERESERASERLRGNPAVAINTTNVSVSARAKQRSRSHSQPRERERERDSERERETFSRRKPTTDDELDEEHGNREEYDEYANNSDYSLTSTTRSFRSAATPNSIPVPRYRKSRSKKQEHQSDDEEEPEKEDPAQQFFRTQRSASIDSAQSVYSVHTTSSGNTRVIARKEIKDLRRSRSERSPSPSQATHTQSLPSHTLPQTLSQPHSRPQSRDGIAMRHTAPQPSPTLNPPTQPHTQPTQAANKAPSSFAQEVVRSLGVQGAQASAAMSVIDRVSRITPAQLAALDPETRSQIMQIRADLGLDGPGGAGTAGGVSASAEQRRQQAEQSHYQRVSTQRATSAPRSSSTGTGGSRSRSAESSLSPSRRARSVTPTNSLRSGGHASQRGRDREREPRSPAEQFTAYGDAHNNAYNDAASMHSRNSVPISAITQSSFGSLPARALSRERERDRERAQQYVSYAEYRGTSQISPMTAASAFSETSFIAPVSAPRERERWTDYGPRSASPQRLPAQRRRDDFDEEEDARYAHTRGHAQHSQHTQRSQPATAMHYEDDDDDNYSQLDFMN